MKSRYQKQTFLHLTVAACMLIGACSKSPEESSLSSVSDPEHGIPLPTTIGTESKTVFHLFSDSDPQKKVIYYISKTGNIRNLGRRDHPIPDLAMTFYKISHGPFAKKDIVQIGGSFDSSGIPSALENLRIEAKRAGYSIQPAPTREAQTTWMFSSEGVDQNGALEVKCEHKPLMTEDGKQSYYVNCMKKLGEEWVPILSPILNARATKATGSDGQAVMSFQITGDPLFKQTARDYLKTGRTWGDFIRAEVVWTVNTEAPTQKVDVEVDFNKVYTYFSDYTRWHDGTCSDREIARMWESVRVCSKENPDDEKAPDCGVKVTYYDPITGEKRKDLPTNKDLVDMISAVQKKFQDKFFEMTFQPEKTTIGPVSQTGFNPDVKYLMRKNTENRTTNIHWKETIVYNRGERTLDPKTVFTINCVRESGLEREQSETGSRIVFNTGSVDCQKLLGL